MKKTFGGLSLFFGIGFIFIFAHLSTPLTFQSLESVTESGSAVFNEISWQPGWKKEIWIMRQSHHGFSTEKSTWDRLVIVVDKTRSPTVAEFYQLASGKNEFEPEKAIPLKARCFACHANGPRAIHINTESKWIPTTWKTQVTTAIWNLRIKTYGQVLGKEANHFNEGPSFQSQNPIVQQKLNLESCVRCHSEKGIRQPLKMEHIGTMRFLVRNGLMPPFPFSISKKDREAIEALAQE